MQYNTTQHKHKHQTVISTRYKGRALSDRKKDSDREKNIEKEFFEKE
jgi:hypothetical protein